jgi:hypothetical protein
MASKIKVDQIAGSSSGTVTIASGTTLNIASGASLTGLTIASGDLPTIPTTKGGTGLTGIGTAGQAIKVNSSGTALEFGSVSADLTNLNASNLTSGTVASSRLSLTSSDLPTVPTTKGGTGLTSIGTANQVLRVNSGATGLEFATAGGGADTATISSTATSGGTLILSSSSNFVRRMTGTSNHTVLLPDATSLTFGKRFEIHNETTSSTITVNTYGGALVKTIPAGVVVIFTCVDIATDVAASWLSHFHQFKEQTGTGGVVQNISPSFATSIGLNGEAEIQFKDADNSNYVGFKAPSVVTTNKIWTLPTTDGSANQFIKTDGSANLSFGSPPQDFVKISSQAITSSVTSVDFTDCFTANYQLYKVAFFNITHTASSWLAMRMLRTSTGEYTSSNYKTLADGAIAYSYSHPCGSNNESTQYVTGGTTNTGSTFNDRFIFDFQGDTSNSPQSSATSGHNQNGEITFFNPLSTTNWKWITYNITRRGSYYYGTTYQVTAYGGGHIQSELPAFNGFKIFMQSGNLNGGTIVLYGLKTS